RERRQGSRAHDQEGVLSRQVRAARSGARRHSQGRYLSQVPIPVSGIGDHALLQPGREGASGSGQESGAVARRRKPSHLPRGRGRMAVAVSPSSSAARVSGHHRLVGTVSVVLDELSGHLEAAGYTPNQTGLSAWWAQSGLWKSKDCLKYDKKSRIIKPQFVLE